MFKPYFLVICLLTVSFVGCVDDGIDGTKGTDGIEGASGIDGTDGINGTDGIDGVNGTDGTAGTNGIDGVNGTGYSPNTMLSSISEPIALMECTVGGWMINYGLDNGDGGGIIQNGVLESGEIDTTTTHCSKNGFGVSPLTDFCRGPEPGAGVQPGQHMNILVGDTIYFNSGECYHAGTELWAYNIFNSSAWQVADIANGNLSYPGEYMSILVGDTIYFSDDDGITGTELWAHDTSNSSTWQVADINSEEDCYSDDGDIICTGLPSNPGAVSNNQYAGAGSTILVGDTIYFSADDGITGRELWAHDTSNSSTWQVADINNGEWHGVPGQYLLMLIDDTIYFDAFNGIIMSSTLWAHDTSNSSTWMAADTLATGWTMSILVGDTIYYGAANLTDGFELWAYDTSNSSAWQVADINPEGDSNPGEQGMEILVGDTIYFAADDGITGFELWAHDTSNSSTWQVADIRPNGGSYPGVAMSMLVGDTIYFDAWGAGGRELWAHDTSNSLTWQVTDINPEGHSDPGSYSKEIVVGDTIYFSATDGIDEFELWAHDTSNSLTWQVTDINPEGGSLPGGTFFMLVGDTIYFFAADGWGNSDTGFELWALDTEQNSAYQ
ncbi:hypothetical protein OAO35_00260 [Euryarchaeota archaeon]|nr:hypothetical protein [Euryarchaeota archaeon]